MKLLDRNEFWAAMEDPAFRRISIYSGEIDGEELVTDDPPDIDPDFLREKAAEINKLLKSEKITMAAGTKTASSGISFGGLLFLLFLALKLTHQIDWSWLWVFAPLWIPFGIIAAVVLVVFIVTLIIALKG